MDTAIKYYELNRKALQEYKEYLSIQYDLIPPKYYRNQVDKVESVEARDGNMAIVVESKGTSYRLNSIYNPIQEARRWIEQFSLHSVGKRFVLFGLGNGNFAKEIQAKLNEDDVLLIYEPSGDIFEHVLQHYDITELIKDSRVSITVKGINEDEFNQSVPFYIRYVNLVSQIVAVHPQYDVLFPEICKWFYQFLLDNRLKAVVDKNTFKALGKKRTMNVLHNYTYIDYANSIVDYVGKFPEQVPAIIVSSGPSLNRNIETLREAKGKSVIIAADSALPQLHRFGVEPDFVVTIDAMKWIGHFNNEYGLRVPLLASIGSNVQVMECHKGRKILFDTDKYLQEIGHPLNRGIEVPSAGSVSTDAFSICAIMGFKRIILVGQDLAYDGVYTHAGQRVANDTLGSEDTLYVEDIHGNQIRTRSDWYIYLQWYKNAVWKYQGEVIDATEGGAKIDGTLIMTLQEAIDQYCKETFDCNTLIRELMPTEIGESDSLIQRSLRQGLEELDVLKGKAEEASELCDKLIEENQKYATESYKSKEWNRRLLKLNAEINAIPVNTLMNDFVSEEIAERLMDMYYLSGNRKDDKLLIYTKSLLIYEKLPKAAEELKVLIRSTLDTWKQGEQNE